MCVIIIVMYEQISGLYDKQMNKDCNYDAWCDYLCGFLGYRKNGTELACGTGMMTFRLAAKGKKLIGVDISDEMLYVAEQNKKSCPDAPEFICADITKFRFAKPQEFIISVCDGINYIKPTRLEGLFKKIRNALTDDGIFIFDVSSEYKLRNIIGENVFFIDEEDCTVLWTNRQTKAGVKMRITVFERQENGSYERGDEEHLQYVHSEEALIEELKNAGFSRVECFGFMTKKAPEKQCDRLFFVAYR